MSFGLRSSGCIFVCALNRVLLPVRDSVENYVDDTVVHSADEREKHVTALTRFLRVIRQSGFTLQLDKMEIAKPEVTFVGNVIGSGCRSAGPSKVGVDLIRRKRSGRRSANEGPSRLVRRWPLDVAVSTHGSRRM